MKDNDEEEYLDVLEELGITLVKVIKEGEQLGLGLDDGIVIDDDKSVDFNINENLN